MPDKLNLSEHVDTLFEGIEGVTEDQKTKMETVLEAAVTSIVAKETATIQEAADAKVEELVEAKSTELEGTLSKYLDYVITEWMEENKLAVANGLQLEMAGKFFDGMKALFVEHNVEVPEGKEDVLTANETMIADLQEKLNASTAQVIELGSQLDEKAKVEIVAEAAEGLTDTQKEKFESLVEGVEFIDAGAYQTKVETIRESYFKAETGVGGGKQSLNEDNTQTPDAPQARSFSLKNL